jgi:type VI secretion system secreted protein Hcp
MQMKRRLAIGLPVLSLLLALGGQASAADKTFLSIPSLAGESTDAAHAGWIDGYALDGGATNASSGGAGVTNFSDISVLKGTDRSTPGIFDLIARGANISLVTIEVCRNTAPQQCYYKVELTNASVSNVDLSGSSCVGAGACTPSQTESVSFRYTKIKWTYTPWTGGSAGTPVTKCWDLAAHAGC